MAARSAAFAPGSWTDRLTALADGVVPGARIRIYRMQTEQAYMMFAEVSDMQGAYARFGAVRIYDDELDDDERSPGAVVIAALRCVLSAAGATHAQISELVGADQIRNESALTVTRRAIALGQGLA